MFLRRRSNLPERFFYICCFDKIFYKQRIIFQRFSITSFSQFLKCGNGVNYFSVNSRVLQKQLPIFHSYLHTSTHIVITESQTTNNNLHRFILFTGNDVCRHYSFRCHSPHRPLLIPQVP